MLNVVIIDDEKRARTTLSKMLALHCSNVTVVGEADSLESGVSIIKKTKPHLVLLDVNLSNGKTGFDLLKEVIDVDLKIIFITAHHEYAVKAIKFSALDYLLKPVDPVELEAAIHKVEQSMLVRESGMALDAFKINSQTNNTKRIILKTQESIYARNISDIICCEAEKNYTTFYFVGGSKLVVSKTLKEYEEILSEYGFFRAHHSYLVNIAHFERFEKRDGGLIIMKSGKQIPVSSRKKEEFLQLLSKL